MTRFVIKLTFKICDRGLLSKVLPCCLLTWVLPTSTAFAQYRFDVWNTDDGLPQNSVTAVVQTRDGYLWLGTFGGLARFDGIKFTVFDVENAGGMKSNRILALHEDRAGNLWIGTERGGLTRYDGGTFTTYTIRDGLPIDTVSSIFEDRQGDLWLATSEGLVRFRAGRFTTYTTKDGLPSEPAVSSICEDRQGDLWFGTRGGLVRFASDRFTVFTTRDGLPENYVRTIYKSWDGRLWVGTGNGGLVRFDGEEMTTYQGLSRNGVRHITEDRGGNLWVGTWSGLKRLQAGAMEANNPAPGAITTYTEKDGLSDDTVQSLFADREGNLWVGTNTGGLNRLKAHNLLIYAQDEGLPADAVVPITEDLEGNLWIGTTCGGVTRFKQGTFTTFDQKRGLPNDCVWSLLADREGSLWIGTWGGGLTRFREGRFKTYTRAGDGLANDAVLSLYQDRGGTLWVGTSGGLNRLEDGVFTAYTTADGLVYGDVRFITEDGHGALWIGTTNGVSRFHAGKFTNYTTEDGLSHNFVRAIYEDADGTIWFGTYGGGLNRFKNGRFTHITTKVGLFENVVSRILEDEQGNFWMTGNKGIFRASRRELNDFADGKTNSITCVSYGTADGMRSNECNGGGQPAGWRTRDGKLWFPTAEGAVMIDPGNIQINTLPPPVVIEGITLNGDSLTLRQRLEVPPGRSDLEIHYTGLSFVVPEKTRFRYKLVGLDDEWIEAGTRRTAYYTHVPPGEYTFTVIAANSDGVWNLEGRSLQIVVHPPFWRTWWFLLLAAAAFVGLAVIGYQRRVSKLKRAHAAQQALSQQLIASQERERKRIAGELHDGLGQSLVIIKNRALLGLNAPAEIGRALEQLDEISSTASQAISEVKGIAHDLRPYQLDEFGLTKAVKFMLRKVSGSSGIRFTADIDALDGIFSKEDETNLYRIVQESINNIVKHSGASEATVAIKEDSRGVRITIRDNGRGFAPGAMDDSGSPRTGLGLTTISERARILGGKHAVHSVPGEGTTLFIKISLRDERNGC